MIVIAILFRKTKLSHQYLAAQFIAATALTYLAASQGHDMGNPDISWSSSDSTTNPRFVFSMLPMLPLQRFHEFWMN